MSTHYYISRMRKGVRLARLVLLSVLGVLCIALQTLLFSSSPVVASSVYRAANAAPPEPPKNVARAGVSVVRLLVTYMTIPTAPSTTRTAIHCTGLGVIVVSWPSRGATDQNNWVLTDGVLVNSSGDVTCGNEPAHPKAKLTSITIVMSSIYNPQGVAFPLPAPTTSPLDMRCSAGVACPDGAVLFAFSTTPTQTLPFIDRVSSVNGPSSLIALVKSATDLSVPSPSTTDQGNVLPDATAMTQFITPVKAATGTPAAVNEPGMPEVDADGHLVDMRLKSGTLVAAPSITDLLKQQPELRIQQSNPVHDDWNAGITAFYQGPSHYTEAKNHFNAVLNSNSQFQGAQTFVQLMSPGASLTATANTSGKTGEGISFFGIPIPGSLVPVLWAVVILLVLVLAAVIIMALRVRRQPQPRPEFQKEWAEAERIASATLEEEMRKQQQAWAQHQAQRMVSEQTTLTPELAPQAFPRQITSPLPCPNCHQLVQRGVTRCPHCRASMLSPTDSGFYPRTQFVTPPPAPAGLSNGVENQPTREMSPSIQMSPSGPKNGLSDPEKTRPAVRQGKSQNVGFSVVTRTNVGKKRKHKPNEDSLFAAQGVREASHAMHQVGLFVVADGMGGHANGQDASQLAIQSIINYILPKVGQGGELSAEEYLRLLTEGVQCANLAVHQRNLEQRADMGTTMTAALVVAPLGKTYAEDDTRPPTATAYIANVGDSRTYLYRKIKGLVKLTNDHSVVASLVEAGIIRPDDIYTHPKRNQIYRSLGEKPAVEVDSFVYPLEVDDKLLLCSDGLWDMVRDPKIEDVLKNYDPDPSMTGDMLIQAALDGGGEDNVSVIVVHIPDLSRQNAQLGIQLIDKPAAVQMPPM